MKRLILVLIILGTSILSLIPIVTSSNTALAWVSGYSYRKSFTVNGTNDGAMTNYQLKLVVNNSTGVSSGSTVYLNGSSVVWPYDFRFTNSSDTNLDYWIESNTSTAATVWVEFNSIVNGSTNQSSFYIYYGKAGDTGASNGDTTFLFFDHFDNGSTLNTSKWAGRTTLATVSSSIMTFTTNSTSFRSLYATTTAAGDVRARMRLAPHGVDYQVGGLSRNDETNIDKGTNAYLYHSGVANHIQWETVSAAATVISNNVITYDAYHLYDFVRYLSGTDTARVFYDNVQLGADATTNVNTNALTVAFTIWGTVGNYLSCDWCFLSNYTLNEPTVSGWGTQESSPNDYLTLVASPVAGGTPTTNITNPVANGSLALIYGNASSCYTFSNWTPTTNISNPNAVNTSVTVYGNMTITANYNIKTYTLTYVNGSNGGITGSLSQTVNCSANGSAVTAVANTCYYFLNWSDSSTANPRTDTNVSVNISVTANFAVIAYGSPILTMCSASSDSISLSWAEGANTSSTAIVWKLGTFPTSIIDGNLLPNQSGYSYTHTGLQSGVSYYYSLWGINSTCYSPSYTTIMCTTTASFATSTPAPLPTTNMSGWSNAPNGSVLSNNPLYGLGNQEADAIVMPHATWWFLLAMGGLVCCGLFIYSRTNNLLLSIAAVIVFGSILAWQMAIIPVWVIIIFGISSLGLSWKELR